MIRILAYAGWVVAALAIVAAGYAFAMASGVAVKADDIIQDMKRLSALDAEHQATIAKLQARVAELEAKLSEQPGPSAEAPKPPSGAGSLFSKMISAAMSGSGKDDKAAGAEQESPLNAMAKMYSGEKGKEMARFSAEMSVNMQYKELFADLKLPPDVEQRLREALRDSMAEQISAGMEAMGGKASPDKMKNTKKQFDDELRAKVAGILNADEMKTWDAYQETLPKRMLNQGIDMQLNMFASDLAPETHNRIRDVLVEELMAMPESQPGAGADYQTALSASQEAYTRARERLAQEFDEAQLGQVDRLIGQMQQSTEMWSKMMDGGKPQEEKPK